jgi:Fur family transcriptional regulator, peroxide stress response regulator
MVLNWVSIMNKLDIYFNALRTAGLRLTAQRQLICEYLAQTDQHPTPLQVYTELVARDPELSRATVYNTLNKLQSLGAIVELSFGADHTHYDTDASPHVNLICLRCHKIIDYPHLPPVEELAGAVQHNTGFVSLTGRLDLLGLCAACHQAASQ